MGSQTDFLVIDCPPQALDEDVVSPGVAAIRAGRDPCALQDIGERRAGAGARHD